MDRPTVEEIGTTLKNIIEQCKSHTGNLHILTMLTALIETLEDKPKTWEENIRSMYSPKRGEEAPFFHLVKKSNRWYRRLWRWIRRGFRTPAYHKWHERPLKNTPMAQDGEEAARVPPYTPDEYDATYMQDIPEGVVDPGKPCVQAAQPGPIVGRPTISCGCGESLVFPYDVEASSTGSYQRVSCPCGNIFALIGRWKP